MISAQKHNLVFLVLLVLFTAAGWPCTLTCTCDLWPVTCILYMPRSEWINSLLSKCDCNPTVTGSCCFVPWWPVTSLQGTRPYKISTSLTLFFLFVLLASIEISSHFSYFHLYHYHKIFGLRICRLRIFRNNSRAQNKWWKMLKSWSWILKPGSCCLTESQSFFTPQRGFRFWKVTM